MVENQVQRPPAEKVIALSASLPEPFQGHPFRVASSEEMEQLKESIREYRDWEQGHYTSIRLFDDYVNLAMGLPSSTCATQGRCGAYYVVETNGSVYPWDFYALAPWKLGSICQTPLMELGQNERAVDFLKESLCRPGMCQNCRWTELCRGGCRRDWCTGPAGETVTYYCPSFQRFFAHAETRIRAITSQETALRRRMQQG